MKHLNLKSSVTFVIALSIGLIAYASEDTWNQTVLTMPTLKNQVEGFTTDIGTFRISNFVEAQSPLQISGGYLKSSKTSSVQMCTAMRNGLGVIKQASKNIYSFKGFIYPFSESELRSIKSNIENLPSLTSVNVTLLTASDSIISPPSVKDFQSRFAAQINSQLNQIKSTGTISFELSQVDDVVCDLILNKAKLEINFALNYEIAKHQRDTVITPDDFSLIYENVIKSPVKASTPLSKAVLNGAILAESIKSKLGKSLTDFGQDRFIRIANVIFDPESANVKTINPINYPIAARSADIISIYYLPKNLKINVNPGAGE